MTTPTMQIKQELDRTLERIRSDRDLSEEAKRRRIAEAYQDAEGRYRKAIEGQERGAAERLARAEREAFSIRYPMAASDAEKAQVRASFRGAYNDVYYATSFIDDPEERARELARMLQRAELSGDPELADAVYHVAAERGVGGVVESYLAGRPEQRKRHEELASAREEAASVENDLLGAKMFPIRTPAEYVNYRPAG
jgi:hypothetical protein